MLGCRRARTDPQRPRTQRCGRPAFPRVGSSGSLRRSCLRALILVAVAMLPATATVSAAQPDTSAATDRSGTTPVVILTAPMHGWVLGTSPTGLAFYAVPPCGCGRVADAAGEGECARGPGSAERADRDGAGEDGAGGCSVTAVVALDGWEVLRVELNEENNFAYSSALSGLQVQGF